MHLTFFYIYYYFYWNVGEYVELHASMYVNRCLCVCMFIHNTNTCDMDNIRVIVCSVICMHFCVVVFIQEIIIRKKRNNKIKNELSENLQIFHVTFYFSFNLQSIFTHFSFFFETSPFFNWIQLNFS